MLRSIYETQRALHADKGDFTLQSNLFSHHDKIVDILMKALRLIAKIMHDNQQHRVMYQ